MTALQTAIEYTQRGWRVIPIPHRSKNPGYRGWEQTRLGLDDLHGRFNGQPQNLGVLLGEPSRWLIDIDLDHPRCVELADSYLPPTPAVFGRAGKQRSHRLYRVTAPVSTRKFKSKSAGMLVECRSTGMQTVFPPSTHESGEAIQWETQGAEPATVDPDKLIAALILLSDAVKVELGEIVELSPLPDVPSQTVSPGIAACLQAMLNLSIRDHKDGSNRLFAAACRAVEHDLNDRDALEALQLYAAQVPFPTVWTDQQMLDRLRDAERKVQRGSANGADSPQVPQFKSARQLLIDHPLLREPVIEGLLRRGETMNIIAASKTGKSWLVNDLALAIVSGRPWLNRFPVSRGDVLILDNELHGETTASRLPKVAIARGMLTDEWADALCIENMRGRWTDIFKLSSYFAAIPPGRFKVIILDAFYRFMPSDTDENDNGTLASIYNQLDRYANRLGCAFILIHHSSKGGQADKAVTDVGAGAGAQSRAADTHLVLRQHEEDNVVVMDAATRSWPPHQPLCLRWEFPIWNPDEALDPTALRKASSRRRKEPDAPSPEPEPWTVERFVSAFVTSQPQDKKLIIAKARQQKIPNREIDSLIAMSLHERRAFGWNYPKDRKCYLANREQSVMETTNE